MSVFLRYFQTVGYSNVQRNTVEPRLYNLYFNTPTTHRSAVYFTINIYYFKSISELEARSHFSAVHHLTAVNTVKTPLFVPFDPIFCFLTQIRPYLIVISVERSL